MKFTNTKIPGVVLIELERQDDDRGFFARTFDTEEFKKNGLFAHIVQCSTSFNAKKGTLRGMHYQISPHEEGKLVRCTRGALYDVALDVRPDSATYKQWIGYELSAENGRMLYIPEGCAHGFQTLEDETEVFYMMDAPYEPSAASGVRFDDPAFGIKWPMGARNVSDKDRSYQNVSI